jgi:hypothetical protein
MVLNCSNITDPQTLAVCYDNYLESAWTDFNKSLADFQTRCGATVTDPSCNYTDVIPYYNQLLAKIAEVLVAMETFLQSNHSPLVESGYNNILNLRNIINRQLKEINIEMTTDRGISPEYEMRYRNTLYVRILWLSLLAFLVFSIVAFIYINSITSAASASYGSKTTT